MFDNDWQNTRAFSILIDLVCLPLLKEYCFEIHARAYLHAKISVSSENYLVLFNSVLLSTGECANTQETETNSTEKHQKLKNAIDTFSRI